MRKAFQTIAILCGIVAMIAGGQRWFVKTSLAQAGAAVTQIPKFHAEGSWPKLPSKWIMAIVSSTWIDEQDHLWVLQRPNTLSAEEKVKAAPPVLEFDAEGNFIQAWGGPGRVMTGRRRSMEFMSIRKALSGSGATATMTKS